jgi:transposase
MNGNGLLKNGSVRTNGRFRLGNLVENSTLLSSYCKPENKVPLGFVEGLNNKIRVIQRRAYGLKDEKYLRLKILTCMLPRI